MLRRPLSIADFVELAQLLLDAGAKPDAHNAHGQSALDVATFGCILRNEVHGLPTAPTLSALGPQAHECDARARALGVEAADGGACAPANVVERIVVLGLPASPKAVAVAGRAVDFSWTAGALTIRRPDLPMAGAWAVDFTF